jgi:hypothetical protein
LVRLFESQDKCWEIALPVQTAAPFFRQELAFDRKDGTISLRHGTQGEYDETLSPKKSPITLWVGL